MKRSEFTVAARRTVQAVFGRSLSDIPAAYPDLFRKADKVCLVFGSGAPRSLEVRTLRLFPDRRNAYFRFRLPFSEKAKTMEQAAGLCSFLFGKGFSRDSLLIAAGGGAVTDLSGFAASIYMRGMNWVSVPTTFLGQIDAGLGGKTAVNLGGAKNIAGTFWLPSLTVCDTAFLDSLPAGELRSGSGELVKYSMIAPAALRRSLIRHMSEALAGNKAALTACVSACADYKLRLVSRDERDETGVREVLNFGHTAGHAFEAMSGGRLPHGLAVARGIRFALIVSRETGLLGGADFEALNGVLDRLRLPPAGIPLDMRRFSALVSRDKKARSAGNRFVLLKGPGRAVAAENVPASVLRKAFEGALK